jgi:hypothetical protein
MIGAAAFSALALMLPHPHTVWSGAGPVQAFALDGARMAWISGACRTVRTRKLSGGAVNVLGNASRTECDDRGTPMIALAGSRALWTELTFGNFTYTYVWTRAVGERGHAKQLDYLVHQNDEDGDWVTALTGSRTTLAYADLVVAGKTLADDTDVYFADHGSFRRVTGRSRKIVQAEGPPLRLAAAETRVAVVYADAAEHQLAVLRPSQTVRVLDLSGHILATVVAQGRPRAVALTPPYVALLLGNRIAAYRYDQPGTPPRLSDPHFSSADLDASGTLVVGHSGRAIWLYDIASGASRRIATASSVPAGLSIDGNTVAWAENVLAGGRIRTLRVGQPRLASFRDLD